MVEGVRRGEKKKKTSILVIVTELELTECDSAEKSTCISRYFCSASSQTSSTVLLSTKVQHTRDFKTFFSLVESQRN